MCYLTTVVGSFHGRVIAARLGAEGILVVLKGATEGPYPLQIAVVPADQLKAAREILLGDAIDDLFGEMGPSDLDAPVDPATGSAASWAPDAGISATEPVGQASPVRGAGDRAVTARSARSRPQSLPTVVAVVVVTLVIVVGFVAAAVH
jgi:hypothetical protein